MNSETSGARAGGAPDPSAGAEIMDGPDKPGHDEQVGERVKSRIHLDAKTP
jgi:hypothetical protein